MSWFVVTLIKGYQRFISPFLASNCRFEPTCSHYTVEAVERYGAAKGLWLGAKRISRCNPFNDGGPDPVP
ncbi:MAG: membrane protein insertion efficiency factor YidD [Chloroflexota bacterium]|nr:membrane protein insertion efficiency factor YidD [Chloroflexota bacterium]